MKANHDDIKRRIKIARGQLDGVLRMIDDDRYCVDIAYQILAADAILKNASKEILRAHIRSCVSEALSTEEPNEKIEEALRLLERMAE